MEVMIITGSTGRIGSKLADALKQDYTIVGLDNKKPKDNVPYHFIQMDVTSTESVKKTFQEIESKYGSKIFGVVHLIAYYDFSGGDPHLYDDITVEGTKRILDELERFDLKVFLFTSTLLVYAPCQPGEKITENWPLDPKWEYPKSKVKTEKLLLQHPCKAKKVILRLAGCYDEECHSIPLAATIRRIYEKRLTSHFFPGNLSHGFPYIHFDDVIDAILLLMKFEDRLSKEEIFILGEEETLSYEQLQNKLSDILFGEKITLIRVPKWLAKLGSYLIPDPFIRPWMIDIADDHYELDISKIKNLLDYEPKHFVLDHLPQMVNASLPRQ